MATFGKLTTGGQNDEIFAGQKYVSAYTLVTDTADVSKLTIDCDGLGTGGAGDVVLAAVIYDDIAGQPGDLVAYGNNVTITHTGSGAGLARSQKDFPISATLEPGIYWLGLVYISGTSQGARYWAAFASGHGAHNGGGITDPFGTPTALDEDVAVFATYTIAVPAAYQGLFSKRRLIQMLRGPGRDTIMGMYGATGAKRSIDAELQQEVRLNYEPAPLVPADVVITAPTASEVITTNPYLVTASVTGSPAPDHLQFEISSDGGTTWERLSAWNPLPPYETNFNTWRYPTGSYKLRARIYQGSDESSLLLTSPVIDFSLNLAAGTTRDYVGGVDTVSAAITAASNGDTIRLDGAFADEGSTLNVSKRVKIIQKPAGTRAEIKSRIRFTADGTYSSEVDYTGLVVSSPEPEGKAAVFRGTPSNPCNITNSGSGIGFQDASTIPFDADGAFDTLIENANIHDCGNRTTQINSAHGAYIQNSTRLFIRETIFYHNAARQIQLYPQSIQATIYKCALYDSEQGILFGGDTSTGGGMGDPSGARQFVTSYCKAEKCIIGKGGGDDGSSTDALIYTFWGNGVPPGPGNIVLNNFLHDPATAGGGSGLYIDNSLGGLRDAGGNVLSGSAPGYTNAGSANFLLVGGANALGYGPDRIQPTGLILQALTATTVLVTATMLKQANKPLSATAVVATASMVRQVGKFLTATSVLVTASLRKQVNKLVNGVSVAVTASLAAAKTILRAMTATAVAVTATLIKQVNKPLSATAVVVTASIRKQVNKALTATSVVVTASLVAMKVILKALTATTVGVTASMVRLVNKPLTATSVAVTASLVKQVNKLLNGVTIVVTASMAAIKVILRTLTASSVVVTGTMVRQVGKPLSVTVALSSSLVKQVNKKLTATSVVVTATLAGIRVFLKTLTATSVVVSASMARSSGKALSASVAVTASAGKTVAKTLSSSVSALASLVATGMGVVVGPFTASVVVADLSQRLASITDLVTVSVGMTDTSPTTVAVTDAGSSSVSAQDASGTNVTVSDLVP